MAIDTTPSAGTPQRTNNLSLEDSIRSKFDDATNLLISKLGNVGNGSVGATTTSSNSARQGTHHASNRPPQLPGAEYYLTLVSVGPQNAQANSTNSQGLTVSQLPAHPAGAALEVLLTFFLSDFSTLLTTTAGSRFISSSLISFIVSSSSILSGGLQSDSNRKDFEAAAKGPSILMQVLESLIRNSGVGEMHEQMSVRSLNEIVISLSNGNAGGNNVSASIIPSEVLIIALESLQVCVRLLLRLSLELLRRKSQIDESLSLYFISPEVLSSLTLNANNIDSETLQRIAFTVCESVSDAVMDACLNLLSASSTSSAVTSIINRGLGILCELVLCFGIVNNLSKQCNAYITCLCKLSVPQWHGHEMQILSPQTSSLNNLDDGSSSASDNIFKWRHAQALIRLLQLIHVIGDVITDWDSIIDCVEQILLLPPSSTKSGAAGTDDSISASDMDKVLSAFQRLISYSAFLSDDSLVKLMSSLVALSLNSLETSNHSHQPNFKVPKSSIFRAGEAKFEE
jgi:hypothetical protein